MNRRGFLGGLVGVVAAPAIVRAESLMKLWVPPAPKILTAAERIAMMKGEILRHAIPIEVLTHGSAMVKMPEGKNISFRRWIPYNSENPIVVPAEDFEKYRNIGMSHTFNAD